MGLPLESQARTSDPPFAGCSLAGVGGLHSALAAAMLLFMEYMGVARVVAYGQVMELSSVFMGLRALDFSGGSAKGKAIGGGGASGGSAVNVALDAVFAVTFVVVRLVLVPMWAVKFLWMGYVTSNEAEWYGCRVRAGASWAQATRGVQLMHTGRAGCEHDARGRAVRYEVETGFTTPCTQFLRFTQSAALWYLFHYSPAPHRLETSRFVKV